NSGWGVRIPNQGRLWPAPARPLPGPTHRSGSAFRLEFRRQGGGVLRRHAVDGELRIDPEAGREQRTIEHIQVIELLEAAIAVGDAQALIAAQRTATHDMGAAKTNISRRIGCLLDMRLRFLPAANERRIRVANAHSLGAGGKM